MPAELPFFASDTPSIAESHPRLYHYTGEYAFRSIVRNNTLWGTYFDDLNDAREFQQMRPTLAAEMGERLIQVVETFARRGIWESDTVRRHGGVVHAARLLGTRVMGTLYQATVGTPLRDSLYPCFVASFCSHEPDGFVEDNGLPSQWRGYGGGPHESYCLVFDTRRFEALVEEDRQAYQFLFVGLCTAHYYNGRGSMPPHFGELVGHAANFVAEALAGPDFPVGGMHLPFVKGATTTKRQGFEEETEIRLVSMPLSQLGDEQMKSAPGYRSTLLKSHFPCEFNGKIDRHIRLFTDRSALPLVRVIIGPAKDQARNAALARDVVGDQVEIVRSQTLAIA